jgi:hypothetical protein
MKLTIDNLDGAGARDYTAFLDGAKSPRVLRKLNSPAELRISLVTGDANFVVPVAGARVTLGRTNGSDVFSGYVVGSPTYHYLGWGERGPLYRYEMVALSDEMLLDKKAPPPRSPFVARSAGEALRQLSEETMPGWADFTGVEAGDVIPYYRVGAAKKFSTSAAEIALLARCGYRTDGGKLLLAGLAENIYSLNEQAPDFGPGDLVLRGEDRTLNDVAVMGLVEPNAHVRDYFVGDGFSTKFYLSQIPFTRSNRTVVDEEYAKLDPAVWREIDPLGVIGVSGGKLQVAGGTGVDGETRLEFIEKIELGGAVMLQHGDIVFNAASNGVIGGLYAGVVTVASCVAGFRLTVSGSTTRIQALVQGLVTGTPLTTTAGHRYLFTTRLYANEVYRMGQVFHSGTHAAGAGRGGNASGSDMRMVLEVHDIDPANPGSQVAPAIVLYDGMLTDPPGFATYALINAGAMQCSVAFTRVSLAVDALVRSAAPQQNPRTRRPGALLDGADCRVVQGPALQFYPQYAPLANETIEVSYRGLGRAMARVIDQASIAAYARSGDDGVRGGVRQIGMPAPRTSADCEAAALALLDDPGQGWVGEYRAWGPFLPDGAADIFPGDGLAVNMPSRAAVFTAVIKEVDVEIADIAEEISRYTMRFVDAGDPTLDFAFVSATAQPLTTLTARDKTAIGAIFLPDLSGAVITNITSTTVTMDAGFSPGVGEGIEVRRSDAAWGPDNDRNLVGRFTSQSFTVTRYGRVQDFFLRRFDGSSPPKYSRYSGGLHLDYPL